MVETQRTWSAPFALDNVPESGKHVDLSADDGVRAELAKRAGLTALPQLTAQFDLSRRGPDSLRVSGAVSATVGQTCVVTLEPMQSEIHESIDLLFTRQDAVPEHAADAAGDIEIVEDAPEPLVDGVVDLGALASEFFLLAIDPYPRKPGAVFDPPPTAADPSAHPFAALAGLKKQQDGDGGT
jgi:uncharacterized metal-binding protein YceD (DUF177 family)